MVNGRQAAHVELRREYSDVPAAEEIQRRNVNALHAAVFGLDRVRKSELRARKVGKIGTAFSGTGVSSGESKSVDVDPFTRLEKEGRIVPPPFDQFTLALMPENNTELGPAIEAMSVNVESFGYRLEPRIPVDEDTPVEVLRTLAEERTIVDNFLANCCSDGESFEELREKCRKDLETTGNCYVEFVEVPGTKRLDELVHLPSWTVRISRADEDRTPYVDLQVHKRTRLVELPSEEPSDGEVAPEASERTALDDAPDLPRAEGRISKRSVREEVSFELREVVRYRKFRRYVQVREKQTTWFKELGDPRLISARSGKVVSREELERSNVNAESIPRFALEGDRLVVKIGKVGFPVSDAANPVRHRRLYSTRSPYGLPRYVGHLFCVFGSRAAEEINYTTFKNNNVPSMCVTVSNGKLDDESVERIEEFVEASIQSDDNYSKFLLLEAEPVLEGMRDPGSMKIDVTPLTREQHTDALFVNYQAANDARTRRAWRFPPVFVGHSEDFSGKTIEASRKLGDEQVFQPERNKVDHFLTRDVLLRLGIVWSKFKSLSPNVTENADLVRLLAQGEKTGGLTPRISRALIGRVVNEDLGEVDPDLLPPDQPFSLTLAQIMKTDAASSAVGGGEPTSQGRAGLQVAGPERDRATEPAADDLADDRVERLAAMIRAEVASRFGGWVPPAFDDDYVEEVE